MVWARGDREAAEGSQGQLEEKCPSGTKPFVLQTHSQPVVGGGTFSEGSSEGDSWKLGPHQWRTGGPGVRGHMELSMGLLCRSWKRLSEEILSHNTDCKENMDAGGGPAQVQTPRPQLPSCVTLDKFFGFSGSPMKQS